MYANESPGMTSIACSGQTSTHFIQPVHFESQIASIIHFSGLWGSGCSSRVGCTSRTAGSHTFRHFRQSRGSVLTLTPHFEWSILIFVFFTTSITCLQNRPACPGTDSRGTRFSASCLHACLQTPQPKHLSRSTITLLIDGRYLIALN